MRVEMRRGPEETPSSGHVEIEQRDRALESLLRALDADPDFTLDPKTTSPKILLAFRLARATYGGRAEAE